LIKKEITNPFFLFYFMQVLEKAMGLQVEIGYWK